MKQTKSAITFLMAQYRAIFKHAYLKGLVSAAALTAGLSAGASQAADFWTYDSGTSKWTHQTGQVSNSVDIIAGSRQTAGKTAAENGVIIIDASTNTDASATTITGSIYGGLSSPAEDIVAIARNNDVFIKSGALFTGNSGGNIIGGKALAKGTLATALADTNDVVIEAGSDITLLNQIIGGHAEGINGATAQSNTVSIVRSSANDDLNKSGIYGGMVRVTTGSIGGDYVAKGNSVSISGSGANFVTLGTAAGKTIVGGYAATVDDAPGTLSTLQSINNSVSLTSGSVGATGDSDIGFIAANYAINSTPSVVTDVIANGSSGSGLVISDSTIYASNIYGGGAVNKNGGNATADNNSIQIINSTIDIGSTNNLVGLVLGGYAANSGIKSSTTMSASNNTITIENTDLTTKTINAPVFGGSVEVTGTTANDLTGSNIQANANSITIGENIKMQISNVYGAKVNLDKSGANITASDNSVEFNGTFIGVLGNGGEVVGAHVNQVATTNKNSATVNGKISSGLVAGAVLSAASATATKPYSVAAGNTVTIGKDAELLNTDIWAVKSAHAAQVVNSTVTIQGKLTDSNIYGGATDTQNGTSTVSLEQGSSLTLNESIDATKDFIISSDTVKLNGDINVARSDNTLTIQGYITDGVTTGGTFNTNQTEIGSTAKIYNAGKITFYGDTTVASGASLHATSNNSQLIISADNTKYDVDFANNTVKNLDKVGGTGSLTLSVEQVKSYLNSGDAVPDTISAFEVDTAGNIQVTSGGALKFTDDTVVLSKFDFDDAAPTVGKIQVDSTSGDGGSIFKGKTVVVEHALASNASTAKKPFAPNANTPLDEDLNEISASGVFIEADVLKLGSNNLIQEQSAEIKFAKATAKNEIDFTVKSGDYQLTSEVAGNNYMRTQDLESKLDYYTALTGTINGDVNVTETTGKLSIEYGHWTAKDNITLTSGGTLSVGGNPDSLSVNNGLYQSTPDATLTLDKSLTLSVATSNDNNKITVTGNGGHRGGIYDYAYAAETIGDDGLALLDLSNGVSLKTEDVTGDIEGKTTLTVTQGGIIKLNASDLNDILAANGDAANITSGAFFDASGLGVFEVAGDVETTFSDFGGGTAHNGITLGANGYLVADSLSVLAQHDSSITDSARVSHVRI